MSSCWRIKISVIFLAIAILGTAAEAGLTLSKTCGEFNCEAHHFCSPTDHTCRPCSTICDPKLNNHDQDRCEADCQDYLHDLNYWRKGNDSLAFNMEVAAELWTLKLLLGLTLSLTTVLVFLSVAIFLKLQLKGSRKKKKPVMELPAVIYRNNQYEKSPPPSVTGPENNNGNNRFRREPSESTLPEYSSYDNPALSPSPTHHV